MIADWYKVIHKNDWKGDPLELGNEYYLIEPVKGQVDVVPFLDIRTYLEMDRRASKSKILDTLDEAFAGWSIERAD